MDAIEDRSRTASHALIGAYLLSLWGLPANVIEAVAFHHTPERLAGPMFDASLAVHIADGLVVRTPGRLAPQLHLPTILGAGITEAQLSAWRARFNAMEAAA